jgi:hypothetical protein
LIGAAGIILLALVAGAAWCESVAAAAVTQTDNRVQVTLEGARG